ncbi:hypothetical protein LWI29_008825 [Acer saccharum]|uniref:Fungal lipase-type domain-containing protein n=1 Tax=Acer saccharum TaxID=4024 RepID=A0AA39S169_ACESA|nr:hypothetical protein LWI29_008825 [Acer saccharum]
MDTRSQDFSLSGPSHLTTIDWTNVHHKRSVAASLVQGVYVVERDRLQNRKGSQALESRWWEFFNFQMLRRLEDVDSSIFGAIYKFIPPASHNNLSTGGCPCYVIAFRGTIITEVDSLTRDIELNVRIALNKLHSTPSFEIAMKAVRDMVAPVGSSPNRPNVWLAGHSLGSATALLTGKTMAKTGIFLESFLFNPPFPSALIEKIKLKKVKLGIRIVSSTATSLLALAMAKKSGDPFLNLSTWVPCLFVNPADHICSGYIGYFEHKKRMVELGVGGIERLATQHSLRGLFKSMVKESEDSEPLHRIPSANLMVNSTPSSGFKQAHGIRQWWRPDLHLEPTLYQYN